MQRGTMACLDGAAIEPYSGKSVSALDPNSIALNRIRMLKELWPVAGRKGV